MAACRDGSEDNRFANPVRVKDLTGVAPNLGCDTALQDIELAVQTEISLVKQHLSDSLWATRQEARAERVDRFTGKVKPVRLRPSREGSIGGGFAMLARFFPGARDETAAVDEEMVSAVLGPIRKGKAACFEDQYISTGGQLYELMAGHDRFVGDLRPLMERVLRRRGEQLGLCCHPYDVCTELIARVMGVVVTDPRGKRLNPPLNVEADVAWLGYANERIQMQVEPVLQAILRSRGLLDDRANA